MMHRPFVFKVLLIISERYATTLRTKNNIKGGSLESEFQQAGVGHSPSAWRPQHVQVMTPSGIHFGAREVRHRPWDFPLPLVPVFLLG